MTARSRLTPKMSACYKPWMPSISLAPVRRVDAAGLIQANIESRAYHEPWIQPFTTLDGFEEWFGTLFTSANVGFVARDLTSGGIVGVTNLSQIFLKGFQSAYLSYYGMAAFAGCSFMTEAVRLTVDHAFGEVGLHRLEANIQPGNMPSIALAKRAGFHKEGFSPRYLRISGVWRDHERWALLADGSAS